MNKDDLSNEACALRKEGWSYRRIASALGMTHPTARRIVLLRLGRATGKSVGIDGKHYPAYRGANIPKLGLFSSEKELEDRIVEAIERSGKTCRRQVRCDVGVIDILTEDSVIEVKCNLTPRNLFMAIGQVLMYRESVGRQYHPEIYYTSNWPAGQMYTLTEFARRLGVETIPWS